MKKGYRSPTLQRILEEMEKQPWHVKLRKKIRVEFWVFCCFTRKYWDKSFEGFIWNKIFK